MIEERSDMPIYPPSSNDERTMAALAHASAAFNLVTGFGGIIAALVIWLTQKDKSPWAAFHGLQALVFQSVTVLGGFLVILITWIPGFIVSFITLGVATLIAVPCMFITFGVGIVLILVGIGYSLYAAYQVYEGRDYLYPWIGPWLVRQQPQGMPHPPA